MSTDPNTDHWANISDNVYTHMPDAYRGHLEMRDAAAESHDEPERTFEDDEHYQAARTAHDEVQARESDKGDWDSSKEHREWLAERYPNTKLNDYGRTMWGWHEYFLKDPANAKEAWTRHWASRLPFHHRPSAKPKEEEAPKDLYESAKAEWELNKATRDAYRSAARDRADAEDYVATSQLRQFLRQNGISLTDYLDKCRLIETASLDDPTGVANRFGVFSGLPATQQQAEERLAAAQQQHAIAEQRQAAAVDLSTQMGIDALPPEVQTRMADFIEDARRRGIAQNVEEWPLLVRRAHDAARNELAAEAAVREESAKSIIEQFASDPANKHYAKLENEVANILMSGRIQRTGDMRADLKTAYDMACRTSPEVAAERARRAARSVTGGPAPGARSAATQRSSGGYDDDLHADVRAAVRAGLI